MTSDCPTCGFPVVWSEERQRVWCSVYGDHPDYDRPLRGRLIRYKKRATR